MLETINKFAPIINSLAVLGSFVFVILTACRKSRRDRIDELKTEMRIYVSNKYGLQMRPKDVENMFVSLPKKYREPKYKELHRAALHEMMAEEKLEFKFDLDTRRKETE